MPLIEYYNDIKDLVSSVEQEVVIIFVGLAGSAKYKEEKGIEAGVKKIIRFNFDVTESLHKHCNLYVDHGKIKEYEIINYTNSSVLIYIIGKDVVSTALDISILIQKQFDELNKSISIDIEKYNPKIAIDIGEVIFAKYFDESPGDLHGLVIDRAARIASLARPCQILISEQVAGLLDRQQYHLTRVEHRKFKGLRSKIGMHEVVWSTNALGIEEISDDISHVDMVEAGEPTVYQYINSNSLIEKSDMIDLSLYTFETLASSLREKLIKHIGELSFRILIRHPEHDPRKKHNIISSISVMSEILSHNEMVKFNVRFYKDPPFLRTYIFHGNENVKGLVSLYRYNPESAINFIGAENNHLICVSRESTLKKHLLSLFQSRFEWEWERHSLQKAVIFDLDGVIIDSMSYYYAAWKEAFAVVDISISKQEIYEREGQKSEDTVNEIYRNHKNREADKDLTKVIINKRDKVFKSKYKLIIFRGIEKLIRDLKNKNIKIGLVTGSKDIEAKLADDQLLLSMFDKIVTGSCTKNGKPSPEPYAKCVEDLGVDKEHCYVVENAPLGIISAKSAGLKCLVLKNNSPLSNRKLRESGADALYEDVPSLRRHLLWVDSNFNLLKFISYFNV